MLALLIPGVGMGGGEAAVPIEVPDVVGELEAVGTTDLENAGFVVSSSTAYSDSVAAGLIISQDPVGGSFANPGSTVEIVVSLGPQPVSADQPTGGWTFLNDYETERRRRLALAQRRKEREEETEQIEDALDRSIAQFMREQEAIDERRQELERLGALAKQNADLEAARQYSERVAKAYARAITQGNYSALDALDRELKRAQEEEDFLMLALMLLVD